MRLTLGLLPMGCVETGSHLCTEFCVFYCDKDIENDIIIATNVAFQFNEKEIVIVILKYLQIYVLLRLLLQPGGAIIIIIIIILLLLLLIKKIGNARPGERD